MKKLLTGLLLVTSSLFFTGCISYERIQAGFVGVKFNLYGADKGVQNEVVGPGGYWLGWNEEIYEYPTTMQSYVFTKDINEGDPADESFTFQSKEGLSINCDMGVTYTIDPLKVPALFQKYRKGIEDISHIYLRMVIRDELVKRASMDSIVNIIGSGKKQFIEDVQSQVQKQFDTIGLREIKVSVVGEFRLPENIRRSINNKIEATQRALQAENELQRTKAEAEKKVAEAKGEAESNMLKMRTITPEVIEWEQIQVQKSMIEKWNGQLPTTVLSDKIPLLNTVK